MTPDASAAPARPRETGGKTMRAAVIESMNTLRRREVAMPAAGPGEALIRVRCCGICGSDIHILRGEHPTARFPVVPGHEFAGELVAINDGGVSGCVPGDLVAAQPFFSCGSCQPCAKGRDNVCRHLRFMGAHVDGAFAEYVMAPARKVYRLPSGFDPKLAALAEPIAVAVHDVRRSGLRMGETALVIGGGAIGILIAMQARLSGAGRVIVSEPNAYRRGMAESLGLETADPAGAAFEAQLMSASADLGFDVVYEASGSRAGVTAAIKHARTTGKVMVIGMTREPYPVDLSAVFAKELSLEGVRIHNQYNFIGAVELLKDGRLNADFAKLITNVFPFERIEEAFAFAQGGGDFMKVLVEM